MPSITVTVPATTANIGPGFDCLGVALSLYNRFTFSMIRAEPGTVAIGVSGSGAERIDTDDCNLVYQAFLKLYQHIGQPPPAIQIEIAMNVPLARGLGSSATAIVGGLVGANSLAGSPLSQAEVMQLAIDMEGHPDNVVPALIGGCHLAATSLDGGWTICDIPWNNAILPVVAIPDFELSTAEARRVLPTSYSRADAIFNTAHLGMLLRGLETVRADWLTTALQDRIHQPYRERLIPGYAAVRSRALQAGAYGLVISGAGPTLLALVNRDQAPAVAEAIHSAWTEDSISAQVRVLSLASQGAMVSVS
jgi:homoserine kinase